MSVLEDISLYIKKEAKKETFFEATPEEYVGDSGNYNDTYDIGIKDGAIMFARELLEIMENA